MKNEMLQFPDVGLSRVLSDTELHIGLMFESVVCSWTSGFQQPLMHSVVWSIDKLITCQQCCKCCSYLML